ncbi:MAG: HAD family hydrolase [Marinilabiliales bacterium]|nr:MAG: HAD family hydrolase [Marinilabiliales bacterium]
MENGRIKNILWDWNGTLLNDMELCIDCMNSLLDERSLPRLSPELYREVFSFPIRDYLLEIGFDFSKEPFEVPADRFVVLYNQRYPEARLFEDAAGTLEHFSRLGMSQFILSAQEHGLLERLLDYYEIRHYFEDITGTADNYAYSKLEAGKNLIDRHKLDPGETVMIGDTTHDHQVADALGVPTLLLAQGHQSKGRLRATGSPVLDDFDAIKKYLENHNGSIN